MSRSDSSAHRVPPYKRPILIVGFLVILAAVVGITVLICKNLKSSSNGSTHLPNPEESNSNVVIPPEQPSTPDTPNDNPPQYEGEDPNLASDLSGVITYRDIDPENATLHSAVTINQYLSENGQCVFNLKLDGNIIRTASAAATPDITTSVCGPFALPIDGLSPGLYQIEIIITGDGKQGTINDEIQI